MTCPRRHPHGKSSTCYNRHACRCEKCRRGRAKRTQFERRRRESLRGPALIDATGARRRLQALALIGWSTPAIEKQTGLSARHLMKIRSGDLPRIKPATARSIDKAFRMLALNPIYTREANITRKFAEGKGWVPALAWDNIDDPKEKPKGVVPQ